MSTEFPTELDTFSNPGPTDLMDNADPTLDHDTQHSNLNDAVEAIEVKIGIDGVEAAPESIEGRLQTLENTEALKLDQTTPQTIVNGAPTFEQGIVSEGDILLKIGQKLIFDGE